jgi:hypothetical protein
MSSALAIIRDVCPTYYYYLVRAIKKILIFNDSRLNSFADLSAHGVVFLNVGATDNEIFFIEDIAHQGGHVVFSTSTFHNNGLFDVDQNTPLRAFTGVLQETRSIYVVLHGLFTEIAIISCLDAYLDNGDLTSRYKHELEGRLAFIISRFAMDLKNMSYNGIFSVRGREMYHHFIQVFETIYEKRRSIIRESNFSNQPYTFNYQRFTELNHANI